MSKAPGSTSPQTPEDSHSFDPVVFWIQNKSGIQAIAGLFAAGLVFYGVSEWNSARKDASASEAFAAAKTPEQLAAFVSGNSGIPLAGNAALLLAEKQRAEKKFDEAIATLRSFLAASPAHPFAGAAYLGIAATQEQQGKAEDALTTYRNLATTDLRGFATPVAWLRIARILKAQGKNEEAKAAYESLQSQFPKSVFANDALLEAQELTPKTPEAPAAATPQTPQNTPSLPQPATQEVKPPQTP